MKRRNIYRNLRMNCAGELDFNRKQRIIRKNLLLWHINRIVFCTIRINSFNETEHELNHEIHLTTHTLQGE